MVEGLMGKLIREEFVHAPSETFTLEASSAKSRGMYAHVGYEACLVLSYPQSCERP